MDSWSTQFSGIEKFSGDGGKWASEVTPDFEK